MFIFGTETRSRLHSLGPVQPTGGKIMKISILGTLFLAATSTTALPSLDAERSIELDSTVLACEALQLAYRLQTFFPGDANYTAQNECGLTPMSNLIDGEH